MDIDFTHIEGIIFDLDGTLVASELNFSAIKAHLGCPDTSDILEYVSSLTDEQSQQQAHQYILDQELADAQHAGWLDTGKWLVNTALSRQLPMAIVTRNSIEATRLKIANNAIPIELVLTREDAPPKPDPTALLSIARHWDIPPKKCLYVGDFIYDEQAANRAGMQFLMV